MGLGIISATELTTSSCVEPRRVIGAEVSDGCSQFDEVMNATDAERRRIARDLHDFTAQHLIAASLMLQAIKNKIPNTSGMPEVEFADAALQDAIAEIRSLSFLYRGPETKCAVQALTDLVEGFSARAKLAISLECRISNGDLDQRSFGCIERVIEECLLNVHRHAKAEEVRVVIERSDDDVVVMIKDDGVGISKELLKALHGVGVSSMRERIKECGGQFQIYSEGVGTTVLAVFPAV